jgi:hypothetical protein
MRKQSLQRYSHNDEAASLVGLRARVRVALQQQTAHVRAVIASSVVQKSPLPGEERQREGERARKWISGFFLKLNSVC